MSIVATMSTRLRGWLTTPEQEMTRGRRLLRSLIALGVHCAAQLQRDRAPQMAAALAYRTLFGLIPTLVLSLILLRFFYADNIREPLQRVIDYIGLSDVAVPVSEEGASAGVEAATDNERLGAWIQMLVERVSEINFAAIGIVGVLVLIIAALTLMKQVDQAFNTVYKAHARRTIVASVTQYWTILTLGPLGIILSFYISDRFRTIVEDLGGSALVTSFGVLAAFFVSWLVLLLAFTIVPMARVKLKPALAGSFVAAALWELGKWAFSLYLEFSTGYARFYGSLALIPIFMLWVYITWLIILFGLELTYALQTFDRSLELFKEENTKKEPVCAIDPLRGVVLLAAIAEKFEQGEAVTANDVGSDIAATPEEIHAALNTLERLNLIHQIERPDGESARWMLSRPPHTLKLCDLITKLAPDIEGQSTAAREANAAMRQSLLEGVGERNLESLLPPEAVQSAWRPPVTDNGDAKPGGAQPKLTQ